MIGKHISGKKTRGIECTEDNSKEKELFSSLRRTNLWVLFHGHVKFTKESK